MSIRESVSAASRSASSVIRELVGVDHRVEHVVHRPAQEQLPVVAAFHV